MTKTSLYSILCIVVRIGALVLFVRTLTTLPFLPDNLDAFQAPPGMLMRVLVLCAVVLGFALLLWIYPGVVARIAADRAAHEIFESPISPLQIERIALAVVGVVFVVLGLLSFCSHTVSGLVIAASAGMQTAFLRFRLVELATDSLEIALGCVLALRSRGLSALLHRVRERGLPKPFTEDDRPPRI